jgi:hypothetical protein
MHANTFSLHLPSRTKLWCTVERADTLPLFLLYPRMYSACTTLQKVWDLLRKKFNHKRDCLSDKREAEKQD